MFQQFLENGLLEKIELSFMAEEAGLVDGEIFQQFGEFFFALLTDQEAVIGVKGIDTAFLQPAQQAVLEEVGAAFVKVHAALLVDERLQQLQFRLGQYGSWCRPGCAHSYSRSRPKVELLAAAPRGSAFAFLSPFS